MAGEAEPTSGTVHPEARATPERSARSQRLLGQIDGEKFMGIRHVHVLGPRVREYGSRPSDEEPRGVPAPGDRVMSYVPHEDGTYDISFGVVGSDGDIHTEEARGATDANA